MSCLKISTNANIMSRCGCINRVFIIIVFTHVAANLKREVVEQFMDCFFTEFNVPSAWLIGITPLQ